MRPAVEACAIMNTTRDVELAMALTAAESEP